MRHREALVSDEFIALCLIAFTYGLALLFHTYGFLAVFAAGLALRRIDDSRSIDRAASPETAAGNSDLSPQDQAASGAQAPANMMNAVERFNSQLESFVEVGIVLVVGVLVATVEFQRDVLWFVPVLLLLIRPLAVYVGLLGTQVKTSQRNLMGWFGIRGIGSLYYLLYAINHNIEPGLAERLLSLTLAVMVTSVVVHGISVTPLMNHYEARKATKRKQGAGPVE
jgi:NhaP-type Na+/H+ or K+/H+ antiporter